MCVRDRRIPARGRLSWRQASYHTLEDDGQVNVDAAWFYSDPKKRAGQIKDRIAFWRGVRIEE